MFSGSTEALNLIIKDKFQLEIDRTACIQTAVKSSRARWIVCLHYVTSIMQTKTGVIRQLRDVSCNKTEFRRNADQFQ